MLINARGRDFIVYNLWERRKAAGFRDMPAYGFLFQSDDYLEERALELTRLSDEAESIIGV